MRVIDNTTEYEFIWNKVYEKLKFKPSCEYQGHSMDVKLPFEITEDYTVYAIDSMTDIHIDYLQDTMNKLFMSVIDQGKCMYALDWQHSAFVFDPYKPEEQMDMWIENKNYPDGGYHAYFPSFFPDGDYYFFIEENFTFGYLGHPWRKEIWIFGEALIKKTEKIYKRFGWHKIR